MSMHPKYESVEEIDQEIDKYFKECKPEYLLDSDGEYVLDKGKPVLLNVGKPTITGLALALGFESRQSMYDYEKKEAFSYTIKRARLKIENSYEQDIRNSGLVPTGSIFALKNFGWSDKLEIDNNHSTIDDEGKKVGIDYSKLSTKALEEIAKASN